MRTAAYTAPKGRATLTAAQTAALLRSLTPAQRAVLAKPGQRLGRRPSMGA